MQFHQTPLLGAFLIEPDLISDKRGWFARTYCKKEFEQAGLSAEWVQFNDSFSSKAGTLRGLHFQNLPMSEIKLVRCLSGKIFDVIVDIRQGSATFLKWYSVELSSANRRMLYIPRGFAHAFQTLVDDCEVFYAHSAYYTSGSEGAIKYNDPAIGINWPIEVTEISERDMSHALIQQDFKGINFD